MQTLISPLQVMLSYLRKRESGSTPHSKRVLLTTSKLTLAALLAAALWQLSQGLWLYAKAELAQALLAQAWQQTLETPTQAHKPWQWADTWPVLRLRFTSASAEHDSYVLANASDAALAFGPGLVNGSALPGNGTTVLAAHRDTHFAELEHVQIGTALRLQRSNGEWLDYQITDKRVVDSNSAPLVIDANSNNLILLTCYPFDALSAGGSLRLVVEAVPVVVKGEVSSVWEGELAYSF